MNPYLDFRSLHDLSALTRQEMASLLETARALRQAADAGQPQRPLRGKNIAVLCESDSAEGARAVVQAASEAGAQVARIRPADAGLADAAAIRETAHLLGRLYDAVACEGVPRPVVEALQRETGVPVYENLGSMESPAGLLAEEEFPPAADTSVVAVPVQKDGNRVYMLQAMLLSTIT